MLVSLIILTAFLVSCSNVWMGPILFDFSYFLMHIDLLCYSCLISTLGIRLFYAGFFVVFYFIHFSVPVLLLHGTCWVCWSCSWWLTFYVGGGMMYYALLYMLLLIAIIHEFQHCFQLPKHYQKSFAWKYFRIAIATFWIFHDLKMWSSQMILHGEEVKKWLAASSGE